MRLFLFRHAEADRPDAGADIDRKLTPRGREDAAAMGRLVAMRAPLPDLVVVSPARRARETWDLARGALGSPIVRPEPRLYEAKAEDLLNTVLRDLDAATAVMLVAHNPGLEDLARLLVGLSDAAAAAALSPGMPTAAVAIVDLPAPAWSEVEAGSGRLDALLRPARD